jgi:hypothetical protein
MGFIVAGIILLGFVFVFYNFFWLPHLDRCNELLFPKEPVKNNVVDLNTRKKHGTTNRE